MNITYHDEVESVQRFPGFGRKLVMDQPLGSAGISMGMGTLEPGAVILPHTHLVEECVTVLEGDVRVLVGSETVEVRGRRTTVICPANVPHGIRNIGDRPVVICFAFPSVGVAAFPAEGVEL